MPTQLFQRLQCARAHSWPLLHPCPYVPPDQPVDANPCPPTRLCSPVHHHTLARRGGRRATSESRRDSGSGSSVKRLERAEQSKKAFIKQWARSVRAATEGASLEGDSDEAQSGNGPGNGRWDSREDEVVILGQRYAAKPRAPMTGITAKSKLTIKSRNCVRHLNLRKSGYSAADEMMFLVSSLVLLQPHADLQSREMHGGPVEPIEVDLNTSSESCSGTENASRPSADVIMTESDVKEGREGAMNDIKMEEPGGWEDEVVQQRDIHVGPVEPIEIDPRSESRSGTEKASRPSADVIMINGPNVQEVREGVMNDIKMGEPGGWEDDVHEVEPSRVPQQKQPGTIERTGSAARTCTFVHARSTGMKVLRALSIFWWT